MTRMRSNSTERFWAQFLKFSQLDTSKMQTANQSLWLGTERR
ncbi:hypothetical protein BJ956_002000 [Arthrobacter psychrochitiniphilus]|nr:hypothetical protein [Arthrobacter psychrochitiniphilus]